MLTWVANHLYSTGDTDLSSGKWQRSMICGEVAPSGQCKYRRQTCNKRQLEDFCPADEAFQACQSAGSRLADVNLRCHTDLGWCDMLQKMCEESLCGTRLSLQAVSSVWRMAESSPFKKSLRHQHVCIDDDQSADKILRLCHFAAAPSQQTRCCLTGTISMHLSIWGGHVCGPAG